MADQQKRVAIAIGAGLGAVAGGVLFDIIALGGAWGSFIGAPLGVFLAMSLGSVLASDG
jgi:hypothetical protein